MPVALNTVTTELYNLPPTGLRVDLANINEVVNQLAGALRGVVDRVNEVERSVMLQNISPESKVTETIVNEMDVKRHLADMDANWESLRLRVENLHTEMLQRHAVQGGMKGKVEMIELTVHEHRKAMLDALEEIRNEVDQKSSGIEVHRLMQRIEAQSADYKAVRASSTKIEGQMNEIKNVYTALQEMNDRITSTLGDNEHTAVSLAAELGEVKGKLENMGGKQASLEHKVADTSRALHGQISDLNNNLTSRLESNVTNKCQVLEGKLVQKMELISNEGKNTRAEQKSLIAIVEEKIDEHETQLQQLHVHLDNNIADKLNLHRDELRELCRRVDVATSERKDCQQDMRRELSQVQEIIQGLQQQYEQSLTDTGSRNAQWNDSVRDLRNRLEGMENGEAQLKSFMDQSMEDMRHQAANCLGEHTSDILGQVESLITERDRNKNSMTRFEEDMTKALKVVSEFDERVTRELTTTRETIAQNQRDLTASKARLDNLDNRVQSDGQRMNKNFLDMDNQLNTLSRDLKETSMERDSEISSLKRGLDFLTTSKIPSLEGRVTDLVKSANNSLASDVLDIKDRLDRVSTDSTADVEGVRDEFKQIKDRLPTLESRLGELVKSVNAGLTTQLSTLKDQVDQLAPQSQLDQLTHEVRVVTSTAKDTRVIADRADSTSKLLTNAVEDLKLQLTDSIGQTQQDLENRIDVCNEDIKSIKTTTQNTSSVATHAQRQCKDLSDSLDKLTAQFSDLQATSVETSSALQQVIPKMDSIKKLESASAQTHKTLRELSDANDQNQSTIQDLQTGHNDLFNSVQQSNTRLDPFLKRLDNNLNTFGKAVKDLEAVDEKQAQQLTELQGQCTDLQTNLASATTKIEGILSKPLATDAALKNLALHAENQLQQLKSEMELMQTELNTQHDGFSADVANKTKAMAVALLQMKDTLNSVESSSKDKLDDLAQLVEAVKATNDDRADMESRKHQEMVKDVTHLKQTTHKIEVGLNDSKALGKTLGEMNERFTSTLNELRASAGGIGHDLMQTKSKVEKLQHIQQSVDAKLHETMDRVSISLAETKAEVTDQVAIGLKEVAGDVDTLKVKSNDMNTRLGETERTVREQLQDDLVTLHEQIETRFQKTEDRMSEFVENLAGKQEKQAVQLKQQGVTADEYHRHNDEIVGNLDQGLGELAERVEIMIDKQQALTTLNQFGVNTLKSFNSTMTELEETLKRDLSDNKDTVERVVTDKLTYFDEKVNLVESKVDKLVSIRDVSVHALKQLASDMDDHRRQNTAASDSILGLFDLTVEEASAANDSSETHKVQTLLKKSVFAEIIKRVDRQVTDLKEIVRNRERDAGLVSGTVGPRGGGGGGAGYSAGGSRSRDDDYSSTSTSTKSDRGITVGMAFEDSSGGVLVNSVTRGGPAHNGGLRAGDIIRAVDGKDISNRSDYKHYLKRLKPNDDVEHTVDRGGETLRLGVTLQASRKP